MSDEREISEEMRSAFVDGQLEDEDWATIAARLDGDPGLRDEICRLRALKDMVRHAYQAPPPPPARAKRLSPLGWKSLVATGLLFGLAGWFGHAQWSRPPALDMASAYALSGDWHSLRGDWGSLEGGKVLVHVSSSGREALGAALDEVEDLLRESSQEKRPIQVEIVANGPGLDLFRANDRVFAPRLAALRRDYPGVSLVACRQTLDRRRAQGQSIQLVPEATLAPSALQEVVERLRAGWIYVRV